MLSESMRDLQVSDEVAKALTELRLLELNPLPLRVIPTESLRDVEAELDTQLPDEF